MLMGKEKWGYDSYDCTGNVNVMRTALEVAHRGWGESCVNMGWRRRVRRSAPDHSSCSLGEKLERGRRLEAGSPEQRCPGWCRPYEGDAGGRLTTTHQAPGLEKKSQ